MAITVVSVAKSYSNRGNHVHRQGTKKRWYLYYIDEDGKSDSAPDSKILPYIHASIAFLTDYQKVLTFLRTELLLESTQLRLWIID
jgi:hypothetical protein